MIRFYAPDIEENPILPESDSGHCIRVLRKGIGDIIEVIDGKGELFQCEIMEANPKATLVGIVNRTFFPNPWQGSVTIAIAPPKNLERMEWMVSKITEIGVDRIVPLYTKHSERREMKNDRLEKIIISATKQSLKTIKPELTEMTDYKNFILSVPDHSQKFIAYCDEHTGKVDLCDVIKPEKDTVIVIGPEGDFTRAEIDLAVERGFTPVSLGPCRLRTETAGIVALDIFHIINRLNDNMRKLSTEDV